MRDLYIDNVLRERRDDTARTVTTWDDAGTPTGTRPYTSAESAAADAAAVAATALANGETIRRRASAALATNATFLALASPTNAQVLAQTKALTRECSALIRLALNQLDSISDT